MSCEQALTPISHRRQRSDETVEFCRVGRCELSRRRSAGISRSVNYKERKVGYTFIITASAYSPLTSLSPIHRYSRRLLLHWLHHLTHSVADRCGREIVKKKVPSAHVSFALQMSSQSVQPFWQSSRLSPTNTHRDHKTCDVCSNGPHL